MSKDEKIYLLAVIYCVSAFAHTSGLFAAFWGFMFVLAGYNFVSAQHCVQSDGATHSPIERDWDNDVEDKAWETLQKPPRA